MPLRTVFTSLVMITYICTYVTITAFCVNNACIYHMYHVGKHLKDLDRTEIHKLLDDDFEHVQTNLIFVVTGTYV